MALVGPLIAIVMIAVMAALLHRSLRTAEPEPAPVEELRDTGSMPDDYGLLAPAAVTRTHAEALQVRQQLREAGIRSTVANTPDGQVQVLVFGDQVVRARRLVGWTGPKPQ
ncbi:hypothetical protein [Allorhizocola rhizosphaerae]|uniref:hypothetical protein n=1 Tax=Allorhizocola rhizosphaerae TaxID=1872709 RepID=UPI000E3D6B29|nr:hypothetical protein [Allorhizocola rhizosphaerae]